MVNWLSFPKDMLVLLESLVSHLFKESQDLRPDLVRLFFAEHYDKPDPTVRDGSDLRYLSQCLPLLDEEILTKKEVIDLCSGALSFYRLLISNDIDFHRYTAIDFSWHGEIPSEVNFFHKSVIDFRYNCSKICTLFSSNGFCYLHTLNDVHCLQDVPPSSKLILIEPYPSIYWNQNFNGITPVYRTPEELAEELSVIGWVAEKTIVYQVLPWFQRFGLPLSYTTRFKKL